MDYKWKVGDMTETFMSKIRGQCPNQRQLQHLALRMFWAALLSMLPPVGPAAADGGLFSADIKTTVAQGAPSGLFRESGPTKRESHEDWRVSAVPPFSPRLRSRTARLDLQQLAEARLHVEARRPARLILNLFTDAVFKAVLERTEPTASGYTLTSRIEGEPLSMVVLAINGDLVEGTVWLPRATHSISAMGGRAAIRQLAPSNLPHPRELAVSRAGDALGSATAVDSAAASNDTVPADDGSVIDVLVVYPPIVRQAQGGHQAMHTLIDHDIASTNEAYRVSGARQRIALAGAFEVDYPNEGTEETGQDGLQLLVGKSDGHMDEVHALRDSYAADLVLFHGGDREVGPVFTKLVIIITDPMKQDAERFAFNSAQSNRIQFQFAHFLGHNMGLVHQRGAQPHTSGKYPYSHGFELPKPLPPDPRRPPASWCTIMAWGCTDDIPRFSNPSHLYPDESGAPLGVPGEDWSDSVDGPADAVRSLNNTRRAVANFRRSTSRCTYDLSPEFPTIPASGGEFNIQVHTAPGCAWTARSHDRFVYVTEGTSGVGNGKVTYRVNANGDWDREAAVLVAGEVFLVKQHGNRPFTPVCARALGVQRALEETTGKACKDIEATDLANIGMLSLHSHGISALETGAFDGLSNVIELDLRGNQITSLPPNLFGGLSSLRTLYLSGNPLTELTPGVFDGLPRLHDLSLIGIGLARLQRGTFSGLSSLRRLHLHNNNLTRLVPGTFEGLPNLTDLGLGSNEFTKLGPDWFRGLSGLTSLYLGQTALKTIDPGAFKGLSNLQSLYLSYSELTGISSRAFKELPNLAELSLVSSNLTTIETDAFYGLSNLRVLRLTGHQLRVLQPGFLRGLPNLRNLELSGDNYKVLPVGLFDGLHNLQRLGVGGRSMQSLQMEVFGSLSKLETLLIEGVFRTLDSGVFRGLSSLVTLRMRGRLGTLPPDLFNGLANLKRMDLSDNPGAPFPINLEMVRLSTGTSLRGSPLKIAIRVREGAPFDMSVSLSASGGGASAEEARLRGGGGRSEAISVTPNGDRLVIVSFDEAPAVPAGPLCLNSSYWLDSDRRPCFLGVQTVLGAPLTLYGFPDQTLKSKGSTTLDLASVFAYFLGPATYEVKSSDQQVASASIAGDLLTVAANGEGTAVLTVTATGGDGSRLERRFTVTVEPSVGRGMSGWRLWLLPVLASSEESGDTER